jgi:hypothetical protein
MHFHLAVAVGSWRQAGMAPPHTTSYLVTQVTRVGEHAHDASAYAHVSDAYRIPQEFSGSDAHYRGTRANVDRS